MREKGMNIKKYKKKRKKFRFFSVCKGLHFIPARFVKSAEIVQAYQRGTKLKNYFACGRTYEESHKIILQLLPWFVVELNANLPRQL